MIIFYRKRSIRGQLEKNQWWQEEERQRREAKRRKEQELFTNQAEVSVAECLGRIFEWMRIL
jgi:hypothetical protein